MKSTISLTLTILFSLVIVTLSAFGASEFDLRKGIDFTGQTTNVTASQLNQLVDAGLISSTNKGGILRRSGNGGGYWPDVTLNPRYTNFLWLDLFSTPPVLKTYVPVGDGYTNWINAAATAAIPNASIGNAQLSANAVQTTNIVDSAVTSAKINAGAVNNSHLAADSVGTVNITNGAVTTSKLAAGAVIATNISASALLPIHFTTGSVTSNSLATPSVGTTNLFDNSVVSNKVAPNAIGNAHLAGQSVRDSNIVSGTITALQVSNYTLSTNQFTTNVSAGLSKAWAVYDGNSATLLKSFNISGALRTSTGMYVFTNTVPYSSTNYCIMVSGMRASGSIEVYVTTNTPGWFSVQTDGGILGSPIQAPIVYVNIFDYP